MAAGFNQKQKMLVLLKIFYEETDDDHAITVEELIRRLADQEINAERRTLYGDIDVLRDFGRGSYEIKSRREGKTTVYWMTDRVFTLSELKILVDSVQAAKFISVRKSRNLIRKLENLLSHHEGVFLHRQVFVTGRNKTLNDKVSDAVDVIHAAIGSDKQIRFRYYHWTVEKKLEERRKGCSYCVSPWALVWDAQNYYLVAYDAEDACIKHYRVDKMGSVGLLQDPREGKDVFKTFDVSKYTTQVFGMFGGSVRRVTIEADNALIGVMIDRFGSEIPVIPCGPDRFQTSFEAALSPQFYGWLFGLGSGVRVVAPEEAVEHMRSECGRILERYGS